MVKFSRILKPAVMTLVIGLILVQPMIVTAMTSSEAKQLWYEAKEASRAAQEAYRRANIEYATDKSEANNQKVIDTGKSALNAALDEAEAWLNWVNLEVEENPEIPGDLRSTIHQDVAANLGKVGELRVEVDAVQSRLQLNLAFLKMVGKYLELVSDVARNHGLVWVHVANSYADKIEGYESELRLKSAGSANESEIALKLDEVVAELGKARSSIDSAEAEYQLVKIPGNPLLRFSSGNQNLRLARNSLLLAQSSLRQAYLILMGSS